MKNYHYTNTVHCPQSQNQLTQAVPANNGPWFHIFCKWIHEFNWLNSRVSLCEFTRFCEKNVVCRHVFTMKSRVFHVVTHTNETAPVLTQYISCQTFSELMTTDRTRVFTWVHMKTCTGGAVPIMNQYDTCQLVHKWFIVFWGVSSLCINVRLELELSNNRRIPGVRTTSTALVQPSPASSHHFVDCTKRSVWDALWFYWFYQIYLYNW